MDWLTADRCLSGWTLHKKSWVDPLSKMNPRNERQRGTEPRFVGVASGSVALLFKALEIHALVVFVQSSRVVIRKEPN